ncbi:2-dehydro-3-deoxygluconokinase [Meiothermus luteus]|jgi:ribokinase|uniref:2-dehydro-3-deoxygluconokinase n=1 Tax=Meiothermus luteus TaxID=2026184 RepID=A0A399F3B1_9DEIN|nr:sugar kinase [Meiothermus luteus]RIH89759.1 2-dehydro-3-deoxygluconokinase [Meiothermus luteus]RMH57794.1 MAG: sugar kinase [Deinococcota bacterium]
MSNPRPLLALGDLTWDVLAKPDTLLLPGGDTTGRVLLMGGGSAANVAVWAARVGYPSAFLGAVGRDRFGEFAVQELEAEGVSSHIVWKPHTPTGVILVLIDAAGQRSMLTSQGADFELRPEELPSQTIQQAGHLHITAWSLFTDPPRAAALRAVGTAQEAGLSVSFDPASFQMIREIGREEFRRLTRGLSPDFVLPNLDEGQALTGARHPEDVLEALRGLYPKAMVLLKLADKGALILDGERLIRLEATQDQPVDATGAGDSFCGAFLGHYLRSYDPLAAGQLAVQVAGWVIARFGARPPADTELQERIARYGYRAPA